MIKINFEEIENVAEPAVHHDVIQIQVKDTIFLIERNWMKMREFTEVKGFLASIASGMSKHVQHK